MRACSIAAQLPADLVGDVTHRARAAVSGPVDPGSEEAVENEVAGAVRGAVGSAGEDEYDVESQAGAGGRGEAGVVALRGAGGDQGVRACREGGADGPFQFADLVATAAQADEVVPFDPEVVLAEAQCRRQTGHGLQRCGPRRQGDLVTHEISS
ncbi:hypothetical protein SAV14893_006220 [Streptomyces avermitilis]|uniref:Uncharacterized protein n=1 Tax=Streptomyces avermitilis TaxID=33903 RepID=A0A4D4N2G3_STRAX|nr:hypothetical protein SAVMC3_18180 [Streptomyces avermitilis]GDY61229.1 hypothetical protein SAV14893_006220 [Streptomyces avermitilis]GDY78688.1 hypothetical protein SAV31267_081730 [Streptomyces avermitilis]